MSVWYLVVDFQGDDVDTMLDFYRHADYDSMSAYAEQWDFGDETFSAALENGDIYATRVELDTYLARLSSREFEHNGYLMSVGQGGIWAAVYTRADELWTRDIRCPECSAHPGWAHGDLSCRREPDDVCPACHGSGSRFPS